jgi:hypothetical protein
MKINNLVYSHSVRRLLLMVPVVCSMAFSACSGVDGTNARANFQSSGTGQRQTDGNLTIRPLRYNSEDHGFGLRWPFGSESTQQ